MNTIIIFSALILINLSVFSQITDDIKIEKIIETSEVKNQYNSGACWCFSTTSFLETEINRLFKTDIELSPMFFVYHNCILQAENYLNNNGNARFSPGGLAFHALDVYDTFGCMPADIFEDNFKYENYDQKIYPLVKQVLDSSLISDTDRDVVITRIKKILDENIATIPDKFEYNNESFTPKDFAKKIGKINTKDYYRITSYEDFGFYKYFNLPIAANWKNETYYNIPIVDFIKTIDYSIQNGFTLLWDGDITEYPIITEHGVDFKIKKVDLFQYPNDTIVTDDLRQLTFNNKSTTDDHNSYIVGTAKDKDGSKYYILKDSNGTDNFSKGFIYLSENYIALKTISIIVHKDGIPENIGKKMTD